ncbi:MAG TPA: hypothetical protein VGD45_28965 [Steroidobacter sp.]|uniref:hypothetical protein n=1 Tax=Steroidobacter sp. TaxID=1978227 RepID=UPI002ED90D16
MVILRFLQSFLDIALWRKGPQDLPASTLLATLALIAYMATGFVRMRLFALDQSTALLFICVDVLMLGGWLWAVLAFFGRRQRFVQTITATLGVGLLVLLLDVTLRSAQLALGWSDQVTMNWLMARFLITALVLGRIFMLALDRGLITGIALTVAIIYSTQAVVQFMLDLRG